MGFEGSLETFSFADILNTLRHTNQEGVLTVSGEKQKKSYLNNLSALMSQNPRPLRRIKPS
jgi:hypothetical protein